MTIAPELLIALVTPIIGGIVWLVRLEGRQTAHERECVVYRVRADERHGEISTRLGEIAVRQKAIDEKLDRLVQHAE